MQQRRCDWRWVVQRQRSSDCSVAWSLRVARFCWLVGLLGVGWVNVLPSPASARADVLEKVAELERIGGDDATTLYRWVSTCNSYVIRRGTRAVIVDPGDGTVLRAVRQLGVVDVDWVLLTGHQRERSQGWEPGEESSTRLAAPAGERDFLEDPLRFRRWHPTLGDPFSVYGASYLRPPNRSLQVDQALVDGEVLRWEGLEIECRETPGNNPGGMTYVFRLGQQTIALTGGLIHAGGKMVNWFDTEWDYGFAVGLDRLIETVVRLQSWEIDQIFPIEGPSIVEPSVELQHYETKLRALRARYVRGYPVFDMTDAERDPVSQPTAVPGLSRVSPHLYKLTDSTRGWNFSIIISPRGHGLILDCGLLPSETLEQLIVGMRQHLGLRQIDAFWISHMHGDHFLLGPLLRNRYGAAAWTLDRIVDRIEHPRSYDYAALVSAYGDGFDGMPIDKAFADGEVVEWEGYRIQVDWMPGQTEFGCSLWLELDGQKVVFTGDNLFGNPADPTHDGHEAVVARNSCLFEEGYLHAADYLLALDPDLIVGSHSYVMPQPREFLRRYRQWAEEIMTLYRALLPDECYQYRFDPYWVSAYPYRVELSDEQIQTIEITIRNFRSHTQRHRIVLEPPPGVEIEPRVLEGEVAAGSRQRYPIAIRRVGGAMDGVGLVALDITLDERRYGQWFDFLVHLGAPPAK